MSSEEPSVLTEVKLPLFERHFKFCTQLGHFLQAQNLCPGFVFRLGSEPQVIALYSSVYINLCVIQVARAPLDAREGVKRGEKLAGVTSQIFVDYLANYLKALLKAVYIHSRGGHLHRDPSVVCGLPALERTLDDLISGLLTQYPLFMKMGGLVLS